MNKLITSADALYSHWVLTVSVTFVGENLENKRNITYTDILQVEIHDINRMSIFIIAYKLAGCDS